MSGTGYIGVDPEYQNAANPLDRPLGDPSPEALRVLENEELCRRVPPRVDWRGNPLDAPVDADEPADEPADDGGEGGEEPEGEPEEMTIPEIKDELDKRGVSYTSSMNKPELLDLLAKSEDSP